ncbi:MAG: ABC transporter permease [Acidimicrobiales bacterium]
MSGVVAGIVGDTAGWLAAADHWHGGQGIPHRLLQHVLISAAVLAAAVVIALPLGLWLGHRGRGATAVVALANVARAVPSFGLIVLGVVAFGIGAGPVVVALVVLAVPPILVNTSTAMHDVDAELKEAARGQGLSELQLLRQVEVPVSIPLILAGIRTAAVLVVATATLAAVVPGVGGLGPYIIDGIGQQDRAKAVGGAVLVAGLAALTEGVLAVVQRLATPAGLRPRLRRAGRRRAEGW